jgi:FixJ family two-component response regulator
MSRPEIYFVDDDATVLTAMKRLLRACGYQVTVFQSVKAFLDHPVDRDDRSCLVVDIHMPGQSGIDLHRAVRAAQRDLPLVFATGAADFRIVEQACAGESIELLQKPFTDTELLSAVARASARRVNV